MWLMARLTWLSTQFWVLGMSLKTTMLVRVDSRDVYLYVIKKDDVYVCAIKKFSRTYLCVTTLNFVYPMPFHPLSVTF